MSTIWTANAHRHSGSANILGRAAATCKRLWVNYITWRIERAAMAHLRSMTDRQLKDLGLSRSEIEAAVTGERARDHTFRRYY